MIILWREKVYAKIKLNLLDAFTQVLQKKRSLEIKAGKLMTKKESSYNLQSVTNILLLPNLKKYDPMLASEIFKNKNIEAISRFVQSIADLSINELTVHYLGSIKLVLDEPYKELDELIQKLTK
jgi:CheY-specific phosphatase CheX